MARRRDKVTFGLPLLLAAAMLAGCDASVPEREARNLSGEPETVDVPQTVTQLAPGTTPMADRVAVIGFLNKRNGIQRDLTLKPGQAVRVGDVIVRLRACETTAPWEVQKLTGAFVQLDVPGTDGQYRRAFSGWLYKETPSLNVVEHPVYDVWPKSCAMSHPEGGEPAREASSSSRSSAPKSAPAPQAAEEEPETPAPAAAPPAPSDNADSSNPT